MAYSKNPDGTENCGEYFLFKEADLNDSDYVRELKSQEFHACVERNEKITNAAIGSDVAFFFAAIAIAAGILSMLTKPDQHRWR
jgi:hypothetical protein